jgi:hypothetical protein
MPEQTVGTGEQFFVLGVVARYRVIATSSEQQARGEYGIIMGMFVGKEGPPEL